VYGGGGGERYTLARQLKKFLFKFFAEIVGFLMTFVLVFMMVLRKAFKGRQTFLLCIKIKECQLF
jgi:hypothetical protein